jgi:hypothetical protein
MKLILLTICGLLLAIGAANCNPLGKDAALDELSPLNEVSPRARRNFQKILALFEKVSG